MTAVYPATYGNMPMPMAAAMPAPTPVQWIPPPGGRAGCPPGLEHFADLAEFMVVEDINPANMLTQMSGVHVPNRYSVRNTAGQQMYFVQEAQVAVFADTYRQIDATVLDANNKVCLNLRRLPRSYYGTIPNRGNVSVAMDVSGSDGNLIGSVNYLVPCCVFSMEIRDPAQRPLLHMTSSYGIRVGYSVQVNNKIIGMLRQVPGNIAQQMYEAHSYVSSFPKDLDVTMKAMLLATLIFYDISFEESSISRFSRYRGRYY